jgi:hypothetical protein
VRRLILKNSLPFLAVEERAGVYSCFKPSDDYSPLPAGEEKGEGELLVIKFCRQQIINISKICRLK